MNSNRNSIIRCEDRRRVRNGAGEKSHAGLLTALRRVEKSQGEFAGAQSAQLEMYLMPTGKERKRCLLNCYSCLNFEDVKKFKIENNFLERLSFFGLFAR